MDKTQRMTFDLLEPLEQQIPSVIYFWTGCDRGFDVEGFLGQKAAYHRV